MVGGQEQGTQGLMRDKECREEQRTDRHRPQKHTVAARHPPKATSPVDPLRDQGQGAEVALSPSSTTRRLRLTNHFRASVQIPPAALKL